VYLFDSNASNNCQAECNNRINTCSSIRMNLITYFAGKDNFEKIRSGLRIARRAMTDLMGFRNVGVNFGCYESRR